MIVEERNPAGAATPNRADAIQHQQHDETTRRAPVQADYSAAWLVRRFALPLPTAGALASLAGIGPEVRP